MNKMPTIEESRKYWKICARKVGFLLNKNNQYPGHNEIQEFDKHSGKIILEYGCGMGTDAFEYLKRKNVVILTDICPENINMAKYFIVGEHHCYWAIFICLENNVPIPYPDDFFDIINCHGVIHHVPNPKPIVDEFYRVLKPNGIAYIMLYTENHSVAKDKNYYEGPYTRFYTEEEGIELLKKFEIEKISLYYNDMFRTFKVRKI